MNPPADQFKYQTEPAPTVTGLNPTTGTSGTLVTITGTNFTGASAVTFGTTNAPGFTVVNDTKITVNVPTISGAINCDAIDVRVTTCVGQSPLNPPADQFKYQTEPAPTVTGLSPTTGTSGTLVTITGTSFTGASAVTFGTTNAPGFTVVNDTTITVNVPTISGAINCEAIDVRVTTCVGESPLNPPADQFKYQTEPAPTVTGLNPTTGTSGTLVTITGTNFTGASAVTFGTTNAPGFTVVNDTKITVNVPTISDAINCEAIDVRVTTCVGESPLNPPADQFKYQTEPAPTVTGLSPTSGPVGQLVTITGTGFTGASAVTFGATNAPGFTVVNDTTITVNAPTASDCVVDVTVTTCVGTSAISALDKFTYTGLPVPVILSLNPNFGPGAGGNEVVITGMNFLGVTGVTGVEFGSTPATSYTVDSSTQITAIAPPAEPGTCNLHVAVTGCAGTSVPGPNDLYTYVFSFSLEALPPAARPAFAGAVSAAPNPLVAPTVTGVSPKSGPTGGTNIVTVTGTFANPILSATFGGVPGTDIVLIDSTSFTVRVPALTPGSPCVVDVIVTTCDGTSAPNPPNDQYTYECVPFPPASFIGCIQRLEFPDGTECTLLAEWTASPSPSVVSYRIYQGNTIVAVIPAGAPHSFQRSLPDCTANGYSITAVDAGGAESVHVSLVIIPS